MTINASLIQKKVASLLLYQKVFNTEIGQGYLGILEGVRDLNAIASLEAYGNWFKSLAYLGVSWRCYLINQILLDDNPFSDLVQTRSLSEINSCLVLAAKHDLQTLQALSEYGPETLSHLVKLTSSLAADPVRWEPDIILDDIFSGLEKWEDGLCLLVKYYQDHGTGIMGQYRAFRFQSGNLVGVIYPDPIKLSELTGYPTQKATLIKNTQFLLSGAKALNILLYGSRGSGKSSLIKALLSEYQSLRLIEVSKSNLTDLPLIVSQIQNFPQKFIIFVDDLSFEEDDESFKALKVVLEGSVAAKPNNMVIYATSNRRHLVREFFGDRPRPKDGDEIHQWDTLQEKLSFSDRFGITLTFEPPDQDRYLEIVSHLAQIHQLQISTEELNSIALEWATRHNGRSGRTARQLIDWLISDRYS